MLFEGYAQLLKTLCLTLAACASEQVRGVRYKCTQGDMGVGGARWASCSSATAAS